MFMLPSLPFRNKLEAPRRKVAILKIVVSLNIKPEKNVVQQDVIYAEKACIKFPKDDGIYICRKSMT